MIRKTDKWANKYIYNCDLCEKEISFKERTLYKIIVQHTSRNSNKACDLCGECLSKVLAPIIRKRKQGGNDERENRRF